jgi:hypothetical protein
VKGRQVGYVLMAMIVVGILGLVYRVVSSGSEDLVLTGLLPIPRDTISKVVIRSEESDVTLRRADETGNVWTVVTPAGTQQVFPPKMAQFWGTVAEIDKRAQLVATNPETHERMGLAQGQGTVVSFFLGEFEQEKFTVGKWTSDVRLCYLRRSGKTEVHAIECPAPAFSIFDADPDGWRNPVIVAIPKQEVESVTFTYATEQFILKISDGQWVVDSGNGERTADLLQVDRLLSVLEVLMASGFATEEEADELDFNLPDGSLRVKTFEGAPSPTTRLSLLTRDDLSYFLKTPAQATSFIVDGFVANELLKRESDFLLRPRQ